MTSKTHNKLGLSREIPFPTKRAVRKECGFGCVICGQAICDYHHFDPPFEKAKQHEVSRIALLCGTCHSMAGRNMLSEAKVQSARKEPYCLRKKTWHTSLDFTNRPMRVVLGAAAFIEPRTVLRIQQYELLSIRAPECVGAPVQVSGHFFDDRGSECLRIEDNIIVGDSRSWDAEWKSGTLCIRRAPREVVLRVSVSSDVNAIVIERLRMQYDGITVDADSQWVRVNHSEDGVQFRGVVYQAESCIDIRRMNK